LNKLLARIAHIESSGHISLVELRVAPPGGEATGDLFSCVVIETPETAPYLRPGNTVYLIFKETEVSIGKNLSGQLSLRNQLPCVIKGLRKGAILTEICLDYRGIEIGAIITTRSAEKLDLKTGDAVTGLIKANEVSIMDMEDKIAGF